jgi:hypothetical protein
MLELLRIYLGYCSECRLPAMVGEFQVQGWKHRFTMCSACIGTVKSKLDKELCNAVGREEITVDNAKVPW